MEPEVDKGMHYDKCRFGATGVWYNQISTIKELQRTRRKVEATLKKSGYKPEYPSANAMRINLPGFSHVTFDKQGQRQIVCYLMKLFDISILHWPLPTKDPNEQLMLFMLKYEMNVHSSLYDDSKKWPLVIDSKMNYVKRTSFCCQVDIKQTESSVPMASSRFIEINVDPETRRPKTIPQWWQEEHGFSKDGPKPEIEDIVKPSAGMLVTERRIHFTDTDENNHANFVVYVRLCLDTFYENIFNGQYPNSSSVFLKGWIKNMKITFKSETVLGDILTIESWEDGDSPNTFHFEMRKGQEVAVTVSLAFYSSLTENNTD